MGGYLECAIIPVPLCAGERSNTTKVPVAAAIGTLVLVAGTSWVCFCREIYINDSLLSLNNH